MFEELWRKFDKIVDRIRVSHEEVDMVGGHHDFFHVVRVASVACKLAGRSKKRVEAAWFVAMCHNADRVLQKKLGLGVNDHVPEQEIRDLISFWIFGPGLSVAGGWTEFLRLIESVVLKHSEPNKDDDHPVLVILKDADRVVNLAADNLFRIADYYAAHGWPMVDPVHLLGDPTATFRDGKTVWKALQYVLEWGESGGPFGLRLKRAQVLARRRMRFNRAFNKAVKDQLAEEGVLGLPAKLFGR